VIDLIILQVEILQRLVVIRKLHDPLQTLLSQTVRSHIQCMNILVIPQLQQYLTKPLICYLVLHQFDQTILTITLLYVVEDLVYKIIFYLYIINTLTHPNQLQSGTFL
jgi:hypothetical protein